MLKIGLCPLLIILLLTSCSEIVQSRMSETRQYKSMIEKDINVVLKDHEQELLSIPGVIGVYVGLLPDEKTLCLKVIVTTGGTGDLKRKIPASIEGYPVIIEESEVIRPL